MGRLRAHMVRVWCGQEPRFEPVRTSGDGWVLGRDALDGDDRMSRRHCEVRVVDESWEITDLGSANSSHVDGRRIDGTLRCKQWRVLQIGRSLFVPVIVEAGTPLAMHHAGDDILGPSLHAALTAGRSALAQGLAVVFVGPEGCGVVPLARALHREFAADGAFVVLDAREAAPRRLPERGLVLVDNCLDHRRFAERPAVSAALQRAGLRVCVGVTCADGSSFVAPPVVAARVRVVDVPPLEARLEEIPWWVAHAIRGEPALARVAIDVTLPEACLVRSWWHGLPDLIDAVRAVAAKGGKAMGRDLSPWAGSQQPDPLFRCIVDTRDEGSPPPRGRREPPPELRERERLARLLATHAGDREATARALEIPREALEQWIRRHRLD